MNVNINFIPEHDKEYAVLYIHEKNKTKDKLVRYLENDGSLKMNLSVSKEGKHMYLPADAVYYIEAEGNTRVIHTRDALFHTPKRLYELAELLPGHFVRISKSIILNINYVVLYTPLPNGLMMAELKNQQNVYIARSYLKNLLKKLEV